MINVKLSNGLELVIDEAVCDDIYFVETLAAVQEDALNYVKVFDMLLGKDQKLKLYKSLEDEHGRVPIATLNAAFEEIMTKAGEEVKNS